MKKTPQVTALPGMTPLGIKPKVELRLFLERDWETFPGCESKSPKIAEGPDWILVVDGSSVEFVTSEDGPSWDGDFADFGIAMRVAYAIIASPTRGVVTALLDLWEPGLPDDGAVPLPVGF